MATKKETERPFMTTQYAAEMWGVNRDTIRRWCVNGWIDGVFQPLGGNGWLIPSATLLKNVRRQPRGTGSTNYEGNPNVKDGAK